MDTEHRVLVTEDGRHRLQAELSDLRQRRTSKANDCLIVIRESGREKEPVAVDNLLVEISFLDHRIAEIEDMLSRATIIDDEEEPGIVSVGSRVDVRWEMGDIVSYTVVGPSDVDAKAGCISCNSPVGRALLGKSKQDRVEIVTPDGPRLLTVLNVE